MTTSRIILLGPPGAGKGTQAARISDALGIPAISTGAIFRANKVEGTELGQLAAQYMDRGEYVPDSVTDAMVRARLAENDAVQGFLLDGYPRTGAQVDALDVMLRELGHELSAVVEIAVPTEELVHRLMVRAQQEGRADDTEEVVRRRMEVYADETSKLTDLYRDRGLLHTVDGDAAVDEVSTRISQALGF